jgi:hypothetical protein
MLLCSFTGTADATYGKQPQGATLLAKGYQLDEEEVKLT